MNRNRLAQTVSVLVAPHKGCRLGDNAPRFIFLCQTDSLCITNQITVLHIFFALAARKRNRLVRNAAVL